MQTKCNELSLRDAVLIGYHLFLVKRDTNKLNVRDNGQRQQGGGHRPSDMALHFLMLCQNQIQLFFIFIILSVLFFSFYIFSIYPTHREASVKTVFPLFSLFKTLSANWRPRLVLLLERR